MPHSTSSRRLLRAGLVVALLLVVSAAPSPGAASAARWSWPVSPFRLAAPYVQPANAYAAGHRGIDLEPLGDLDVRAPAAGVVAFVGDVAGRPIVTIDHGGGLVSTLEPVTSTLTPGTRVDREDVVGELSVGGHAEPGTLHFGVRLDGEYINPLLLLGGVPRAVLLPCCD
ncbi:M23 family metallopeptidase [Microbacterium sp. AZCO]|uniref:murein hydrolase activator EnvC family protein n=1 Tax=Microbacterium sp. AZCO TaxID=3142976 RepID=UPI0031F3FFEA